MARFHPCSNGNVSQVGLSDFAYGLTKRILILVLMEIYQIISFPSDHPEDIQF